MKVRIGMVTRKDYKAIAKIIENLCDWKTTHNHPDSYYYGIRDVTEKLADYFATDNPRFSRQKFLNACGLGD